MGGGESCDGRAVPVSPPRPIFRRASRSVKLSPRPPPRKRSPSQGAVPRRDERPRRQVRVHGGVERGDGRGALPREPARRADEVRHVRGPSCAVRADAPGECSARRARRSASRSRAASSRRRARAAGPTGSTCGGRGRATTQAASFKLLLRPAAAEGAGWSWVPVETLPTAAAPYRLRATVLAPETSYELRVKVSASGEEFDSAATEVSTAAAGPVAKIEGVEGFAEMFHVWWTFPEARTLPSLSLSARKRSLSDRRAARVRRTFPPLGRRERDRVPRLLPPRLRARRGVALPDLRPRLLRARAVQVLPVGGLEPGEVAVCVKATARDGEGEMTTSDVVAVTWTPGQGASSRRACAPGSRPRRRRRRRRARRRRSAHGRRARAAKAGAPARRPAAP